MFAVLFAAARSLSIADGVAVPDESRPLRYPLVGRIAAGYPIEKVADSVGFQHFSLGHKMLRGTATLSRDGEQALHVATGFWGNVPVKWVVYDLDNRQAVAEGEGHEIRFGGVTGVRYMISVKRAQ